MTGRRFVADDLGNMDLRLALIAFVAEHVFRLQYANKMPPAQARLYLNAAGTAVHWQSPKNHRLV
jgi:hypothetical protein